MPPPSASFGACTSIVLAPEQGHCIYIRKDTLSTTCCNVCLRRRHRAWWM